jgi:cell division protein FtsB
MPRLHRRRAGTTAEPDAPEAVAPGPVGAAPAPVAVGALGSLADLPVAGLTRRRVAILIGALVAAWVIVLFARQVSEASEATARADAMRVANVQLETEVSALGAELTLIQRQEFIAQAARQYRLGKPKEIPFTLEDGAPDLPANAPGSALVRLGTRTHEPTPLESWSRLLFGDPPGVDAGH